MWLLLPASTFHSTSRCDRVAEFLAFRANGRINIQALSRLRQFSTRDVRGGPLFDGVQICVFLGYFCATLVMLGATRVYLMTERSHPERRWSQSGDCKQESNQVTIISPVRHLRAVGFRAVRFRGMHLSTDKSRLGWNSQPVHSQLPHVIKVKNEKPAKVDADCYASAKLSARWGACWKPCGTAGI